MQDKENTTNQNQPNEIRDQKGRFKKGESGNPGGKAKSPEKAPRVIVKELIGAKLTANDGVLLHRVLDKMIADAANGCPKARAELFNRWLGLPKADDDNKEPVEITIKYQNAAPLQPEQGREEDELI